MNPITKSVLLSRKRFLQISAILFSAYPLKLLFDVSKTEPGSSGRHRQQILPLDLPEGISFHGHIIAVQKKEEGVFFSADCPHLGCQINRFENDQLICPCHGSHFSLEGEVLEGPATKNLSLLTYTTDTAKRQHTVLLPT